MWHTSVGRVVYDPYRASMKAKTQWWCVLDVDKEITRYYREAVKREYHLHSMVAPAWDAHVSIIRGERPEKELMHLWKKYDGMRVEFHYKHDPRITRRGDIWTIDVVAPFLSSIRDELHRPSNWGLHMSIGKERY